MIVSQPTIPGIIAAMNSDNASFFKPLGERIAKARKERGLTQVQVADHLGVAQQTFAHYETGRARIAASLLPMLADILDLTLDELLVGQLSMRAPGRRGPASRLAQQLDAVTQLPKARQRFVVEMIDTLLAQQAALTGQEAVTAS